MVTSLLMHGRLPYGRGLAGREEYKAKRAFYTIKKSINTEVPIRTWLKIFRSIIEPTALYGSEVWGPLD